MALKGLVEGPGYGREMQKRQSDLSTMMIRNLENLDVYNTILHAGFKELLLEMLGTSSVSHSAKANLLSGLIFTTCKPQHFNVTRLDFMKIFNSTSAQLRPRSMRQKDTYDTLFNLDHCNGYLRDRSFLGSLIDQFVRNCDLTIKSTSKSRILVRQNLEVLKLYLTFLSIPTIFSKNILYIVSRNVIF